MLGAFNRNNYFLHNKYQNASSVLFWVKKQRAVFFYKHICLLTFYRIILSNLFFMLRWVFYLDICNNEICKIYYCGIWNPDFTYIFSYSWVTYSYFCPLKNGVGLWKGWLDWILWKGGFACFGKGGFAKNVKQENILMNLTNVLMLARILSFIRGKPVNSLNLLKRKNVCFQSEHQQKTLSPKINFFNHSKNFYAL